MRLRDILFNPPTRVSFTRRGGDGGSITSVRSSDSVTLVSPDGTPSEIGAATDTLAGVMTASDRLGLAEAQSAGQRLLPASILIETTDFSADVREIRSLSRETAGDLGGTLWARSPAEPVHDGKLRSLDRFRPDGTTDSADGGWWEMKAGATHIAPEQFGARGDGVFDDTPAFLAMRSYLLHVFGDGTTTHDELVSIWLAPQKHYTYTNNKWIYGLSRVRIQANGAKLECTNSTAAFEPDAAAFNLQPWETETGFADRQGAEARYVGDLIQSAAQGQLTVSLQDAGLAANYAPGDVVMIVGFANQDDGQPPNYRFFEYHVVDSVAGGDITLSEELRFDYFASWPGVYQFNFTSDLIGPARILRLNRPNRALTRYLEINDAVFIRNRNDLARSRFNVFGALHIRINDCDATDMEETVLSSAKLIEIHRSRFSGIEGDKLLERAVLTDCEAPKLTQFVGTMDLDIVRGTFRKTIQVGARRVRFSGTRFDGAVHTSGAHVLRPNYPGDQLVESMVFQDIAVSGVGPLPLYLNSYFVSTAFTGIGPGGELLFAKTGSWADLNHIYPDARMISDDGVHRCRVLNFVDFDASNWGIEVEWESAVPPGPVTLHAAINRDLRIQGRGSGRFNPGWQRDGDVVSIRYSTADPVWQTSGVQTFDTFGHVRHAWVHVLKPFTGSGTPILRIRDSRTLSELLTIDLGQAGYRDFTPIGASGLLGIDSHDPLAWGFVPRLQISPRTGGSNSITGTPEELPTFALGIEVNTLV